MARAALGVLLAVLLCPEGAAAQGFPSFDAVAERVVVGPLPVRGAQRVPDPRPVMRGSFTVADDGLRVVSAAPVGETTWIAEGVQLQSGIVRARFLVGSKLDSAILTRARVVADPSAPGELDGALAISLERGKVLKLYRYVNRAPKPLGAEAKIDPPLIAGTTVEIVVVLSGPVVMASAYDGETLALRAHVAAHDAPKDLAHRTGAVGVRVNRAQDTDSRLVFLSASVQDGPTGFRDDDGASESRLVKIAPAALHSVPAPMRVVFTPVGPQLWANLDPTGVERLRRNGAEAEVDPRVPFFLVDRTLLRPRGVVTATDSGFRVDEGYKDAADVEAIVRAYADRFSTIARLEQIGTSTQGRPLLAIVISDRPEQDEGEPAVLLDAAHHGGELPSTEAVLDAMQQLLERYALDGETRRVVDNLEIWCVPLVNPDGLQRFVDVDKDDDRKNGRGVDLYRNYPVRWGGLGEYGSRSYPESSRYRGPAPASEPEVQAMVALAERERFVASIDFHTAATMILAPYTDPGMKNPTPNEAWTIAEEINAALPMQPNNKRFTVVQNLYPVDGTAQDFFRHRYGTVALLVEMPQHNPQPYPRVRASIGTVRPSWQKLLLRVLDGPRASGVVRADDGTALDAEVRVEGTRLFEGERWGARPADGRFDRLLIDHKPVRVTFSKDGFVSQTVRVDPRTKSPLTVVMSRAVGAATEQENAQ